MGDVFKTFSPRLRIDTTLTLDSNREVNPLSTTLAMDASVVVLDIDDASVGIGPSGRIGLGYGTDARFDAGIGAMLRIAPRFRETVDDGKPYLATKITAEIIRGGVRGNASIDPSWCSQDALCVGLSAGAGVEIKDEVRPQLSLGLHMGTYF